MRALGGDRHLPRTPQPPASTPHRPALSRAHGGSSAPHTKLDRDGMGQPFERRERGNGNKPSKHGLMHCAK